MATLTMATSAVTGTSGPPRRSGAAAGQGQLRVPKRVYPLVRSAKVLTNGMGPPGPMPASRSTPRPVQANSIQHKPNFASQHRSYAQVVKQNIPGWLRYTSRRSVYRPPTHPKTEEERQQKAKAKYGSGYRTKPPNRNRRVWEHFLARNHKLARDSYSKCPGHVQRVVQERERVWTEHPQGSFQRALLTGEAGLYQKGVIYALVNEETNFHVNLPVYIGQTTGHVVDRTQRHVDKAQNNQTSSISGLEPKIIESLRNTERWWTKWIMLPLETVPLPTTAQPGTPKYLEIFRASAIVREQAWIHRLKTGFPGGLNIEVHPGNPNTRQRREFRKAPHPSNDDMEWQEVPSKRSQATYTNNEVPQSGFIINATGLHFSTEPGHSASIRRRLEQLLQTEGKEQQQREFLKNLPSRECKRMLNWLAINTPQDAAVRRTFQRLSAILSNAHKTSSHATQHILQTYDATTPAQQERRRQKKEEAESFFWIKVPWRNNELQTLGLHVLINSPEVQRLYPISQEKDKVKISYNLAVPNGVLMQNYGKCQKAWNWNKTPHPPSQPLTVVFVRDTRQMEVWNSMAMWSQPTQRLSTTRG